MVTGCHDYGSISPWWLVAMVMVAYCLVAGCHGYGSILPWWLVAMDVVAYCHGSIDIYTSAFMCVIKLSVAP